jgi:hypothetical protein
LGLYLDVILVCRQFPVAQLSKPVAPVFVDAVFVMQIL